MGVEQLVSTVGIRLAEELIVKLLYLCVAVALADGGALVLGINGGVAFLFIGIKDFGILVRQ